MTLATFDGQSGTGELHNAPTAVRNEKGHTLRLAGRAGSTITTLEHRGALETKGECAVTNLVA